MSLGAVTEHAWQGLVVAGVCCLRALWEGVYLCVCVCLCMRLYACVHMFVYTYVICVFTCVCVCVAGAYNYSCVHACV